MTEAAASATETETAISAAYAQGVIDERNRIYEAIQNLSTKQRGMDLYGFEYKNYVLELLKEESEDDSAE